MAPPSGVLKPLLSPPPIAIAAWPAGSTLTDTFATFSVDKPVAFVQVCTPSVLTLIPPSLISRARPKVGSDTSGPQG